MNTKKTVLVVLVILLLVFYLISMASIQSKKQEIKAIRSGMSSSSSYSYHQAVPTARPTSKPATSVPRSAGSSGSARREIDTGPSTDDFYHPEDFYDWYKDDFIDYEDAEEYYYEHGGY